MNISLKEVYRASYYIKMRNPCYTKGDIVNVLHLDKDDYNVTHRVALGIWQANKKLGITRGYSSNKWIDLPA
tara:strand:- start:44 stop:259 length:216 start_codon:yes stop_codon:yes gene_type:complete